MDQLLDKIAWIRDLTGRPVGVKTAIGGWQFMNELAEAVHRRGLEYAPDFLAIDGGEGGSGAAPQALVDHMALSIDEALPRVVDALIESGLKQRVRVIAAGKLVTSARAAWALCVGADFVNTARGFMFSLGCIQALRCHQNTCPTGVTTHNQRLQRGLVVEEKYLRVANYAMGMNHEIDMIAHSCGCGTRASSARARAHRAGATSQSIALNMLYPYPSRRRRSGGVTVAGLACSCGRVSARRRSQATPPGRVVARAPFAPADRWRRRSACGLKNRAPARSTATGTLPWSASPNEAHLVGRRHARCRTWTPSASPRRRSTLRRGIRQCRPSERRP